MSEKSNETVNKDLNNNNPETPKKTSILKSFLDYFYGNFVVLLLGFISLPLITRVMSTDEYGRTAMYQSAVSIIYICAILGLDQGYIRFFYKEGISRKKLFFQCLYPPFILILCLSAIYLFFSDNFNMILFERHSVDITVLVIAYVITSVFERFLFLNIRMDQNGKLYSNLNILSKVLYIIFILLFVNVLGDDFRVVLYALSLPLIIVTVFLMIRFLRLNRSEKINLFANDEYGISETELLKYSIPFVPMLLMEWLLSSMDKWAIRFANDFSETGIYSAAMQIMTIVLTVKITFVAFWSPIAMEKFENDKDESCKIFFADVYNKVQFLCMGLAFSLTTFRWVIVLILGAKYRDAIQIIPFLALMPVLSILFEMTGQGVKFVKKIKYFNYASLVAILCNFIGNFYLVPRYRGIGAAMATGVTYIVYFIIGTYFANKCYPVKYNFVRFALSMIIYISYAAFATVTNNQLLSCIVGCVCILAHCVINYDTIREVFKLAKTFLNKNK